MELALQTDKVLIAIDQQSQISAAFTSNVLDTSELAHGEFEVKFGTLGATLAVFRIQESDTQTNATTLGGTPNDVEDFTPKPGAAQNAKVWVLNLRKYLQGPHKRYIQLQATAGAGASDLVALFRSVSRVPNGDQAAARGVDRVEYVDALDPS